MAGRPRKPPHLKLIAGTDRRDRAEPALAAAAPSSDAAAQRPVPSPPKWMKNAAAKAEWKRLVPFMVRNGFLTEGTFSAFGHYCSLHGKLVELWGKEKGPNAQVLAQFRAASQSLGLPRLQERAMAKPEGAKHADEKPENRFAKFRPPGAT